MFLEILLIIAGKPPSVEASSSQTLLQFLYRKEVEEQYEKENFYSHLFTLFQREGWKDFSMKGQ